PELVPPFEPPPLELPPLELPPLEDAPEEEPPPAESARAPALSRPDPASIPAGSGLVVLAGLRSTGSVAAATSWEATVWPRLSPCSSVLAPTSWRRSPSQTIWSCPCSASVQHCVVPANQRRHARQYRP